MKVTSICAAIKNCAWPVVTCETGGKQAQHSFDINSGTFASTELNIGVRFTFDRIVSAT